MPDDENPGSEDGCNSTENSNGPTAKQDPTYLDAQECTWSVGGEQCGTSPAAHVADIYYGCKDHFEDIAEWFENGSPSPIISLSDGPRLILADGSVVRPVVKDLDDNHELAYICHSQGAAMYGDGLGVNETASIAFVDDPEAAEHQMIKQERQKLGVE